jgi:hypothetical protein
LNKGNVPKQDKEPSSHKKETDVTKSYDNNNKKNGKNTKTKSKKTGK